MEIDNADWGAFAVSKKILKGVPVAYSIRTQSFRELNGWRLISLYDSEEEQMDPNCYTIAAMTTLIQAKDVYKRQRWGDDSAWLVSALRGPGWRSHEGPVTVLRAPWVRCVRTAPGWRSHEGPVTVLRPACPVCVSKRPP